MSQGQLLTFLIHHLLIGGSNMICVW